MKIVKSSIVSKLIGVLIVIPVFIALINAYVELGHYYDRNVELQSELSAAKEANTLISNELADVRSELLEVKQNLADSESELTYQTNKVTDLEESVTALGAAVSQLEQENKYLTEVSSYVFNGEWNADYSEEDVEILAGVMYGENYISGRWEMMLTGSVVLNRVISKDYPNSIKEVIYQIAGPYEQYAKRTKNLIGSPEVTSECYELARLLLEYGPVAPPFVLYQAHKNQGNVYWEWKGEQFCYRSKEDR